MEFDDVINERRSVRKFSNKKPDWRDIIEAIEAGRKAPLAGNIPSVKFILVDKPEIIAKLVEASQEDFVADAQYVVVVCSETSEVVRSYDERGDKYAKQQAGAAIENFILKLTDLGLDSCWIGAFVDEQVKNALKIPEKVDVEAFFPIGYAMQAGSQKRKPSLDRVMYFNKYKEKFMKPRKNIE